MKYEIEENKVINIPDKDIQNLMQNLQISENEAVYTWLVDEEIITDATVEELTKKAKENRITATVHQAKEEKQKKERKRVKKENPEKSAIIKAVAELLTSLADNVTITNETKIIEFNIKDNQYKLDLICKRKPKK